LVWESKCVVILYPPLTRLDVARMRIVNYNSKPTYAHMMRHTATKVCMVIKLQDRKIYTKL